MKLSKTTWWMIGGSVLAVSGIGLYLVLSKKKKASSKGAIATANGIFPKEGTPQSVTQKARVKQEPNWNKPFNYGYIDDVKAWLAPKKIKELPKVKAIALAKVLKQAKGTFNDDEKAVGNVFGKQLRDKTQVCSVSRAFYDVYKKDLWQHLDSFLSAKEMQINVTIPVRKLVNY
ncbi:hypothetical protein GCM10011344_41270 [Dokdonia pacifica]|uniref:Uncharacterized protein n=1 Tax=Dokdonia pacifica TaxID=1627892 RepID=A0A239ADJ2_9FLAO|nr:hypothetical protein [Dokdonia pacifica]GGG36146.1 hypothetical protein GCM10011344_41270 [Dokdonia pacifica]SNR93104.1 hypothetical protein SAMN06265376_104313 [Dokdonia pacifica]